SPIYESNRVNISIVSVDCTSTSRGFISSDLIDASLEVEKGGLSMKSPSCLIAAVLSFAVLSCNAFAQTTVGEEIPRIVLLELFPSQGCDMCPEAERLLGELAARSSHAVPIALHVDYFNNPWKDPFSDKLYSERQAAYNTLYTKPKNAEYGLYYTPMVMVDGL